MTVVEWLTALALQFAPPDRAHQFPGYVETVEQRTARYESIASDIVAVVDKSNPRLFSRQQNAAFLLAVGIGESGLDLDADKGPCYRVGPFRRRCDGGLAVGILQIQVAPERRAALFADRRALLTIGLRGIAGSFRACAKLPVAERLAAYGSGNCDNPAGRAGSRKRFALFQKLMAARPVPEWTVETTTEAGR